MKTIPLSLSFDDVLLLPQYNDIPSRKDPSIDLSIQLSPYIKLKLPIISSPMDTVTEYQMAVAMHSAGGLGIIHRYMTIEEQIDQAFKIGAMAMTGQIEVGFAIGATGDYLERALKLNKEAGIDIFCIDVAHGHSQVVFEAVQSLRKALPKSTIIAGNVATREGLVFLAQAGADAVRVGIGGGANCSSRLVAGHGNNTFQSLLDCGLKNGVCVIADGGIKNSGDSIKGFAIGANAIMLGNYLSGTPEAPGPVIEQNGKLYKAHRGMASRAAQEKWRPEMKGKIVGEGEESLSPFKPPVKDVLYQLEGGIRSGMTYSGARTIKELQEKAKFVQITQAGHIESRPHAKIGQ